MVFCQRGEETLNFPTPTFLGLSTPAGPAGREAPVFSATLSTCSAFMFLQPPAALISRPHSSNPQGWDKGLHLDNYELCICKWAPGFLKATLQGWNAVLFQVNRAKALDSSSWGRKTTATCLQLQTSKLAVIFPEFTPYKSTTTFKRASKKMKGEIVSPGGQQAVEGAVQRFSRPKRTEPWVTWLKINYKLITFIDEAA